MSKLLNQTETNDNNNFCSTSWDILLHTKKNKNKWSYLVKANNHEAQYFRGIEWNIDEKLFTRNGQQEKKKQPYENTPIQI